MDRPLGSQDGPRYGGCCLAVILAGLVGLGLMADALGRSSATYDEVAYLEIAARWWRTGEQERITRMGSPLTFWKVQQAPVLWWLDHLGHGHLIDDPITHQATLLPYARAGSLSVWVAAWVGTVFWSRRLYGPRAMVMAAWLFALSPNLLAHGALATMELPLVAGTTALIFLFWQFLMRGDPRLFVASAAVAGLTFSFKFTTVLVPPLLALAWGLERWWGGDRRLVRLIASITVCMLGYLTVMLLANVVVTGFATVPMSPRTGSHPSLEGSFGVLDDLVGRAVEWPIPQDWVGFATQMRHQRSGGSSYLFGERRLTGWWYYYFVALAVKVPLTFWLLVAGRAVLGHARARHDRLLPVVIVAFLVITAVGSSRNYGVRYLLPLAPLAIVWVSALAESGRRWAWMIAGIGLVGQAVAVVSIHPHPLSYFNALAGGPRGGRHILADSNLDWGQGARALARLQRQHPGLRDLTLFYFGDTDPAHYGVVGRRYIVDAGDEHPGLPPRLSASTAFLAVSASLQWGPWGPADYFQPLDGVEPVGLTDDATIALYRTADLEPASRVARESDSAPSR